MPKIYRIYQIDAFTKTRFKGNPAGVVPNADGLRDQDMRMLARELNNSETAFIFSDHSRDCDLNVRFFTPTVEVPICGHATIAAHYVYALEHCLTGHSRVMQRTGAGILPVDIYEVEDEYRVVMTQGDVLVNKPLPSGTQKKIMSALRLPMKLLNPDLPMSIASTGHSKVMIGISSPDMLHAMCPELGELAAISAEIGCSGFYVFTLHPGEAPLVHGRMFAPACGVSEDPVTGNANGALGAYLVHVGYADKTQDRFVFDVVQGEAIGRAGTIKVDVSIQNREPVQVCISGTAVVAFQTEITL